MSITAHCLVKNEEVFLRYAILSVIDFIDRVIIFDTGSSDRTLDIIHGLCNEYPNKIFFEQKGLCDMSRHTELRQEMIEKTNTPWFMILDGDEIWTKRGVDEACTTIKNNPTAQCIIAPFYLCVGDIFHRHYKEGNIAMLGKRDYFYPRFFKIINGIHWQGKYNEDIIVDKRNLPFFTENNTIILKEKYWHATHLKRSNISKDFSSGGTRSDKLINTYFVIGRKIQEQVPEVFHDNTRLSFIVSFINFWPWIINKIFKKIGMKNLYKYWMKFAHLLGTVNGYIILFIFYFLIIGLYAFPHKAFLTLVRLKKQKNILGWKEKDRLEQGLENVKYQF